MEVKLTIRAWATTDLGSVRSQNEDSYLLDEDLGLYAVADGMGGHQRGEVASALACDVLREHIAAHRGTLRAFEREPSTAAARRVEALLEAGFIRACKEIYDASATLARGGQPGRMGTTLDAVLVLRGVAFTAHVGDGRIYIARGGEAHPVTEDHSLVQEQVRSGLISPAEARRSRKRNVITRALGAFPSVLVDTLQLELDAGDRLLLCSDGLHGRLDDHTLGEALREPDERATQRLVALATERGSRDNITAMILSIQPGEAPSPPRPARAIRADHVEILRGCQLFSTCTFRELLRVAEASELRAYPRDSVIFQEGDRGQECFIVARGAVDLLHEGLLLSRAGPSDFFGELSFFDEPGRSASAIAREEAHLLVLSRVAFLGLLRRESALANKLLWRLLVRLSQVVRATNAQVLAQLTQLDDSDLELLDPSAAAETWE